MYARKTKDVYEIHTNYGYGWDIECPAEDLADAKRLLKEYRENAFGRYAAKLVKRREKIA